MTPKQKAIELIESYMRVKVYRSEESFYMTWYSARECARIAVDQILIVLQNPSGVSHITTYEFWKQVMEEL